MSQPPALLLLAAFFFVSGAVSQQVPKASPSSVSTSGTCSPVVTNPQAEVTIKCESAGLSKADAEKQAKEYSEILNRIRASSLDMKQVLTLLNGMKGDITDIKTATAPRHLTEEQKTAILKEFAKVPGERIWIAVNAADPEAPGYAREFVDLARQAKLKLITENESGFDSLTYEPPIQGLQLAMNKEEVLQKRAPKVCDALFDAFQARHITVKLIRDEEVQPNVCQLFIGSK